MCKDCFNHDIKSFESEKDYLDFDLVLTKKLANEKTMTFRQFVGTEWKDIGYTIYECHNCGQLWGLRDPDNADRGFFTQLTKEGKILDKNIGVGNKLSGRLILTIIIVILILGWFVSRH